MGYELIIESGRTERGYWRDDLWQYRELFQALARRGISVRYKETVIGAAWAHRTVPDDGGFHRRVRKNKIAKLPSDGTTPYALMIFAGMLPWSFFSAALAEAANSVIGSANPISRVYFPRLILPTAAVMVAFVDSLISFVILVGLMIWYGFISGWLILLLPAFAAIIERPKSGFSTPVQTWLQWDYRLQQWKSVRSVAVSGCPWARRWAYQVARA